MREKWGPGLHKALDYVNKFFKSLKLIIRRRSIRNQYKLSLTWSPTWSSLRNASKWSQARVQKLLRRLDFLQEGSETSSMGTPMATPGQPWTGNARQDENFLFWSSMTMGAEKSRGRPRSWVDEGHEAPIGTEHLLTLLWGLEECRPMMWDGHALNANMLNTCISGRNGGHTGGPTTHMSGTSWVHCMLKGKCLTPGVKSMVGDIRRAFRNKLP
jgi:hypothetical protein